MKRMIPAVLVASVALATSGCVAKTTQQGVQGIEKTNASQCNAERRMIEQAIEAYTILEGAPPVSEAAMVPDFLRIESIYMDIDAAGNVVPSPTGGCG
jgi:Flp pilus assembly protein TadD